MPCSVKEHFEKDQNYPVYAKMKYSTKVWLERDAARDFLWLSLKFATNSLSLTIGATAAFFGIFTNEILIDPVSLKRILGSNPLSLLTWKSISKYLKSYFELKKALFKIDFIFKNDFVNALLEYESKPPPFIA